jgi:hypothetical protein
MGHSTKGQSGHGKNQKINYIYCQKKFKPKPPLNRKGIFFGNVRVGYRASKNIVQKYKVYVTMIQVFDFIFLNDLRQAFGDNWCPSTLTNCNYKTHLLCQAIYILGMNKPDQYSFEET